MKKLLAALLLFSLYACKRDKSLCEGETHVQEIHFSTYGGSLTSPIEYRIDTAYIVGNKIVFDLSHDSTYRPVCQTIYVSGGRRFYPQITGDVASQAQVVEHHSLPIEVDKTRSPDTVFVTVVAYDPDTTVWLQYAY